MNVLTKVIAVGWLAIVAVVSANYAGVGAAAGPAAALIDGNGGVLSPLVGFAVASLVLGSLLFTMASRRNAKLDGAILRDKPRLRDDRKGLARERRIRIKEAQLQAREVKTLKSEAHSEKRIGKEVKREGEMERKREALEAKKERLRERRGA